MLIFAVAKIGKGKALFLPKFLLSPSGKALFPPKFLLSPSGRVARSAERGHDRTRPLQSAIADSFPEGEAKNNGKESRRENHFARISRAPHSPRLRSAPSPQGEGLIFASFKASPCLHKILLTKFSSAKMGILSLRQGFPSGGGSAERRW